MDLNMSYGRRSARSREFGLAGAPLAWNLLLKIKYDTSDTSKMSIIPSLLGLQLQNANHVQHFMKLLFLARSVFPLL